MNYESSMAVTFSCLAWQARKKIIELKNTIVIVSNLINLEEMMEYSKLKPTHKEINAYFCESFQPKRLKTKKIEYTQFPLLACIFILLWIFFKFKKECFILWEFMHTFNSIKPTHWKEFFFGLVQTPKSLAIRRRGFFLTYGYIVTMTKLFFLVFREDNFKIST